MGTIQNSINQTVGAITGSALGVKHMRNQAEATELAENKAAIEAGENVEDTVNDAIRLGASYDDYKKLQDSFKADELKYDKQHINLVLHGSPESRLMEVIDGTGEEMLAKQKDEAMNKKIEAGKNVEMLQKSLNKLALVRDAKRLQAKIYRDQINKVGKKGEDMGIYKLPWEEENK